MNNILLVDCCSSFLEMDLNESSDKGGLTKFRGKFQEAEAVNKNKRMYPFDVLDENLQRLTETINNRQLVGELDHPAVSIIHFGYASHVVTKLWWDNNTLMGEGEILNTPSGKVLKALINDGIRVGISSRGVGNGKVNEDGILVIGESYKLITFDAVADPSTFAAFQEKVTSKKETFEPSVEMAVQRKDSNNVIKTEDSGIDRVSKEAVIAYLGGIVKHHSEKQMSRLG